jgi:predicted methyltransferase
MYHTHLAHLIWKDFLKPGMTVIDATAGNGNDTLFLAKCVLTPKTGLVHAFDIQEDAIKNTENRLQKNLSPILLKRITLHVASHETFPIGINPSLVVYNLGYLPGGDLAKTTLTNTTINSCNNALDILLPGGLLSITIYPGHPEGNLEKSAIFDWLREKPSFQIFYHTEINKPNHPSLITLRKPLTKSLSIKS